MLLRSLRPHRLAGPRLFVLLAPDPFPLTFLHIGLGLGAVRLIVRHDVHILADLRGIVVIDTGLGLRVGLRANDARTGQMVLAWSGVGGGARSLCRRIRDNQHTKSATNTSGRVIRLCWIVLNKSTAHRTAKQRV